MPENSAKQTEYSTDLVTYKILVNGIELPSALQVLSIVVEKEINRIPTAKITLIDGDPSISDFEISNDKYFIPGNEIEITAGYQFHEESIFKGLVIRHSLKIRPTKSILIIECKDQAIKLTVGRKNKYFYKSKDSEIVSEILDSYGIVNEVEETNVTHPEMVQYNVTDWDFMVTRAQANGKVCLVDDGIVSMLAPNYKQDEKQSLVYGDTILDFDAEIDACSQFWNVTSFGWDSASQSVLKKEADIPNVQLNGNIKAKKLASVIDLEKLELKDGGSTSDASLQDWANAKSLFNQLSKITGHVKFQGVANVKPNTTLVLSGVGDRFNGKVYVSAIRHFIGEGTWTVDAQFGIDPKWFTEKVDINPLPASGLLSAVHGLQIAVVTKLQDDPDAEYRVQVRMPIVNDEDKDYGVWARIATLDAGDGRGSFFRPEIEDEVIVGFLNGNPNDPIILGMLNSSDKPAPFNPTDENHEKGFVTRSEMKFVFDDEKKSVTIETPVGKIIQIDEDAGLIKLEDENSNVVTLNDDGIALESAGDISISASGDVTIEGTNIELKANGSFKAEGAADAEVSSSGITVIKGSMVNIN